MNCTETTELLAADFEGVLEPSLRDHVEAHLLECRVCRMARNDTAVLVERLTDQGRASPPPSLGGPVMERILREQALRLRRSALRRRIVPIAAAAACLLGIWLASAHLGSAPGGGKVHADERSQARKQGLEAKSATWKTSYYQQYRSQDGKRSKWVHVGNNEQEFAYRTPGLYHVKTRHANGDVVFTATEDIISRSKLEVNALKKTATLRYLSEPSQSRQGPFATPLGMLQSEDLQFLGKKEIGKRTANGFRLAFFTPSHNQNWSYDVWIDTETKQLLTWQVPGADLFNPADILESGPGRDPYTGSIQADGARWVRPNGLASGGFIMHDIAFDVALDDSLFRLTPPDGFALKAVGVPAIEESDVIEFIQIVAEYFDGTFPEKLPRFNQGPEYDRFERIEHDVVARKPATPAEVKMVEAMHRWWSTGIPGPGPMHIFIHQHIVEGSWKYLGQGVELGDKSRIVCWYRPKSSQTYRVVYGDLSIKDVAAEDLPLPVER